MFSSRNKQIFPRKITSPIKMAVRTDNKRKAQFHKRKLFGSNEIKSDLGPPFFCKRPIPSGHITSK